MKVMRMLFVCFVVVLFISGKSANPVKHVDVVEASGETENLTNEEVETVEKSVAEQLNSENEVPEEHIGEPIKRTKKSHYPGVQYPSAPYPSAQYSSAPYQSSPCSCSDQAAPSVAYNAPQNYFGPPEYGQPQYGQPKYGQPQYGQPQYGQPQYGQLQYGQPQYGQPQYGQPQYGQPQYGQPQYGQPQHGQPQYGQPQYGQPQYRPKYGGRKGNSIKPKYQTTKVPKSSYQLPLISYQPSYQPQQSSYQPTYQSAPGPSQTYSYPSTAPNVPCASNVLVGCQLHTSEVPCSGYPPAYGSPEYAQPQYPTPAYRSNLDESGDVSLPPANPSNELTPDKVDKKVPKIKDDAVASILNVPNNVVEKGTNNENKNDGSTNPQKDPNVSANQQILSPEEAKLKKYDTLIKMSELAKTLAKDDKGSPNQLPNAQKTIEKSTLTGPQPTSTNVAVSHPQFQPNKSEMEWK